MLYCISLSAYAMLKCVLVRGRLSVSGIGELLCVHVYVPLVLHYGAFSSLPPIAVDVCGHH